MRDKSTDGFSLFLLPKLRESAQSLTICTRNRADRPCQNELAILGFAHLFGKVFGVAAISQHNLHPLAQTLLVSGFEKQAARLTVDKGSNSIGFIAKGDRGFRVKSCGF